jgi:glyoxylase-like metal-dependent hydrolase (beta-lactamase superfamily II)
MQIAPGLLRIGTDVVALHAVLDDTGVTLIDAGLPGHLRLLERELAAVGRSLADIRGVVLTHGDSDHIGIAERLRREHGVPVFVHEADAARARGEESTKPAWGPARIGPVLRFLGDAIRHGGLRSTPIREVRTIADGDVLHLPSSPRVIGLPGHSPGSIAVHVPAVGAVFVGDAMTTRHVLTGRAGAQPAPFTDDQADAARSLEQLRGLDARLVIPGHGPIWAQGVDAALDAYAAAATSAPAP